MGLTHAKFAGNRTTIGKGKEVVSLYHTIAVVKGRPYVRHYVYVAGTEPKEEAFTPVEETTLNLNKVVIALETSPAGEYSLFQESGPCDAAYVGTGVAIGDPLEVIAAGTSLILTGTTGTITRDIKTCAYACEANASGAAALKKVLLLREVHQVAAT